MAKRKKNARKGAEEFFYENAGYSWDPKTQTKEEGRRETAKALADAEQWAWDNNYEFMWHHEEEDWRMFLEGTEIDPDEVSEILLVEMRNADGETVEALGGIMFGHDVAMNQRQGRVYEAELALEQQSARSGNPTNRLVVTADSEAQARTRGRRFGEVIEVREVGPDKYWVYVNQRSGYSNNPAPTRKLKSKLLR